MRREKEEREGVRDSRERGKRTSKGHKYEGGGQRPESSRHGGNHVDRVSTSYSQRRFPTQIQHRREEVVQKKVEAGLSYSGVVLGERRPEKVGGESPVLPVLEILPAEDLLSELESCFVGRLFQHLEVEALQTCLFIEGWRGIKVVPLGEKLVLLKGNNMQDIVKAREEKQAWWSATFSEVVPWSPNLVATIRRVWIQLRGIPLHI
ncbi:hypothetical protein MtrunA17_Chr1g0180931 [Medicago truncatula]|uniref:DUF4283 domain protein n=1 Tax=Medicago truncatula TaxID=3880 RepID=A0A396JU54_MEDTR|nr:hypothetical protein MtrunA17_Chr1g0180931 [Medicago truncatula]